VTPPRHHSSIPRSVAYLANRWIFRRPFLLAKLPEFGLRFRVKTEDVVGRHIYKYHVHEAELTALLFRVLHLQPDDVVIDIGGNIGWYSVLLDRLAPDGVNIFAFEPDPQNFELLQANIGLNDARKVLPVQKALAAEEGVQTLYQHNSRNLGRHSLLRLQDGLSVDVETTTLDSFWSEQGLGERNVGFIKIDIEGYELFALRGATRVLERCPALLCEYSPKYMRTGDVDPAELIDLLIGLGFQPNRIVAGELLPTSAAELADVVGFFDLFWRRVA
jgi:FkbM family methyltransferase